MIFCRGTFGIGSSGHMNMELLQNMSGAKFQAVHYKGATPALATMETTLLEPSPTTGSISPVLGIGRRGMLDCADSGRGSQAAAPAADRRPRKCLRFVCASCCIEWTSGGSGE